MFVNFKTFKNWKVTVNLKNTGYFQKSRELLTLHYLGAL